MKGAIAVLIACMMSTALSACAGAPKEAAEAVTDHQNTEETKVSGTESSAEAKAPAKAPAEETLLKATEAFPVDKKKEAKEKALLPELEVTRHVVTLDNLGDTAFEGTYSEAVLTDACEKIYPALSESIRFACVSAAAEVELALATTAQDIEEYGYDGGAYAYNTSLSITRADRRIMSLCFTCQSFFGGFHPSHLYFPCNFDTATGEEIRADTVIRDMDGFLEALGEVLWEEGSFADMSQKELSDSIRQNIDAQTLLYGLGEDAFLVYLDENALGSYVQGLHIAELPFSEYGDLFNTAYTEADPDMDLSSQIQYLPDMEEPHDISEYLTEGYGYREMDDEIFVVENPGWKRYVSDSAWPTGYQPPLTKVSEESCFAEDWYSGYGMTVPTLSRYANGYTYIPLDSPATSIRLVDDAGNGKIFDFSQFATPKDADWSNPFSDYTEESILYALEDQGVLYVSIGHRTYASAAPSTGFLLAVDMEDGSVLWMSDPQVANAQSFVMIYDSIVCGYGFTAEDDYIYILDIGDGHTAGRIRVKTAPKLFTLLGSYLYVACYDTGYVYRYQ